MIEFLTSRIVIGVIAAAAGVCLISGVVMLVNRHG